MWCLSIHFDTKVCFDIEIKPFTVNAEGCTMLWVSDIRPMDGLTDWSLKGPHRPGPNGAAPVQWGRFDFNKWPKKTTKI